MSILHPLPSSAASTALHRASEPCIPACTRGLGVWPRVPLEQGCLPSQGWVLVSACVCKSAGVHADAAPVGVCCENHSTQGCVELLGVSQGVRGQSSDSVSVWCHPHRHCFLTLLRDLSSHRPISSCFVLSLLW